MLTASLGFWAIQVLNGLAYGMLLFLLASGLTIIFGLMKIVNLTHGAYYLLGSYITFTVTSRGGSHLAAALASGLVVACLGVPVERFLLRRLHGRVLPQVLITLGLAFVLSDLALFVWGGDARTVPTPPLLRRAVPLGITWFPAYRLFLIGLGVVVALALWLVLERTRLGAVVRAGVDNEQMVRALGIDIDRVFSVVFAAGAFLAGVAGSVGAPFVGVYPGLDFEMLPLSLVVLIVGGIGSVPGAFVGSILVALVDNLGRALFPNLSHFTLFVPMAAILAFRPRGLFGRG